MHSTNAPVYQHGSNEKLELYEIPEKQINEQAPFDDPDSPTPAKSSSSSSQHGFVVPYGFTFRKNIKNYIYLCT